MHYVLIGNYGAGNLGDELLKEYFLTRFPEVEWHVVSAHPKRGELHRLPLGIRSLLTPWWRTIDAIRRSHGVVFGGGTLFTDSESLRACFLWGVHAWIASLLGKPIFLAFQGIGPFRTSLGKRCARSVVAKALFLSVRDEASARCVQSLNLNKNSIQSFDPILSLIEEKNHDSRSQNMIISIPRQNSADTFKNLLRTVIEDHPECSLRFLRFAPDNAREERILRSLQEIFPGSDVRAVRTLGEAHAAIRDAAIVVSERYHGALLALALGKDTRVPDRTEGDKLRELMNEWRTVGRETLEERLHEGENALRNALEGSFQ